MEHPRQGGTTSATAADQANIQGLQILITLCTLLLQVTLPGGVVSLSSRQGTLP